MRLQAILRQRCPHCLRGQVFSGLWRMNERCPLCGVRLERETGYFMMSVFIGYILSLLVVLPVLLALYLMNASIVWYLVGATVTLFLLSPLIFRYGRILWMHLDELLDPRREAEVAAQERPEE
jgi:uncharacterized protein (DUF983 family)